MINHSDKQYTCCIHIDNRAQHSKTDQTHNVQTIPTLPQRINPFETMPIYIDYTYIVDNMYSPHSLPISSITYVKMQYPGNQCMYAHILMYLLQSL